MNWGDIFFPGNPGRREELICKNQELEVLMENNFRATNKLIRILHKHLGYSFREISLNHNADVKHNCDVIIERVREIQNKVGQIDDKLKQKLEPELYEKLKNMDLNLSTSDQSKVAKAVGVTGASVGWLMTTGRILEDEVLKYGLLKLTAVAGLVIGVVFLGIDMIVGAITGSIERDKLQHALKEYDEAFEYFKLASEEYRNSIYEVIDRMNLGFPKDDEILT